MITADPETPARRLGMATMVIALLAGLLLWLWVDHGSFGSPRTLWVMIAFTAVAIVVPAIRHAMGGATVWDSTGKPPSARLSVLVAVIATVYFAGSAQWQGRDLSPHAHDEFMYLTQASQLAAGRLWSTIDPAVADFFDSPYVIVHPVYAVLSWPGTSLFYAPGNLLGAPPWMTAVILAGAAAGFFFQLARELGFSKSAAIIAVIFLIVGRPFHSLSVTVNAHLPVILTGEIAVLAIIYWTRTGRLGYAAMFGVAGGWAVICRPVDAICLLLPIVIVAVFLVCRVQFKRKQKSRAGLAVATLALLPFIALQLVFDRGVTGRWLDTPFTFYCRRDYPQVTYGFPRFDPTAQPMSIIRQKRQLYDQFAVPFVLAHQPSNWLKDWITFRIPTAFRGGQPAPLLLLIVPLGAVLLIRNRRVWALAVVASLPMFCVLYAPYTIFLPTYAILCGPAIALCAAVGGMAVANVFRSQSLRAAITAMVIGVAIAATPEINSGSDDPARPAGVLAARSLDQLIPLPQQAVVLVRYHPGNSLNDEPVYNWKVAAPDQARIVLAHDLGLRNVELFRHYAKIQPDRQAYLLDRSDYSLNYLGSVTDLAR